MKASGGPFVLPRLAGHIGVEDTGLFSEAGSRLGFYDPGQRPRVYDPTWTRTRTAEATVVHEDIHQQLTINTHHGLLTQLLVMLESGRGNASSRACLDEQWSVQELAATYTELAFIRRTMPDRYVTALRCLPTAVLDQPPYRELYDLAEELLPVEGDMTGADRVARQLLVLALAACAMQTGCLRQLASTPFDDEVFASYLRRESPHRRFEQIVTVLGAAGLRGLASEAARRFPQEDDVTATRHLLAYCVGEIRRLVPEVAIEDTDDLARQGEAAAAAIEAVTADTNVVIRHEDQGLSPEFVDAPEKRQRIQEIVPFDEIDTRTLEAWLRQCERLGGDLNLIVAMPGAGGSPFAAVCLLPPDAPEQLDDLRGRIDPGILVNSLRPFENAPRVITFSADAWRAWYQLFAGLPRTSWVHERMMNAVRICVHRTLSLDHIRRLLEFEDLADDAGAFVMQVTPELFVGCFTSARNPRAYAFQKIPSRAALRVFEDSLETLGVEPFLPDERRVPHLALLERIVSRESVDPAGV